MYDRVNLDDQSKSKSILQLASDVPYGKGEETVLLPDAIILIKVSVLLWVVLISPAVYIKVGLFLIFFLGGGGGRGHFPPPPPPENSLPSTFDP